MDHTFESRREIHKSNITNEIVSYLEEVNKFVRPHLDMNSKEMRQYIANQVELTLNSLYRDPNDEFYGDTVDPHTVVMDYYRETIATESTVYTDYEML